MSEEKSIVEQVREELGKRDLTQLAQETGYSYQWLWLVKEGQISNPGAERIIKLKTLFDVSTAEHSD